MQVRSCLDMLESSVDGGPQQGEQAQISKSSPDSLLRVPGAVAQGVHHSARYPDPACSCRQLGHGQASCKMCWQLQLQEVCCQVVTLTHGEEEEELRKILQGVLMRSLDAVENCTVLAVHLWIFNPIFLASLK